jgi:uncharacterized protein YndB with AHSA1/START domain
MAKKEIKKAVKKAAKPAPKKATKPAAKKAAKTAVKKVEKPAAKKPAAPAKKAQPVKPVKKEKETKKQTTKNQPKEKVKETIKAKTLSKAKEKPKEKEIAKPTATKKGKPAKEEKKKKGADNDDEEEIALPEDMMLESADIPEPDMPAPKLSNKEKQKLKQLQAKALAKVRAAQRAKEHAEMLAAAAASLKPVARSKSGRVSYTCEYVIKSSPTILFEFVTTPSGLVQWFADRADINGEEITFNWKGSEESAAILEWVEDERVRYRWEWHEDDEFFQFRIYKNDITMDTVLEVTDFAEEKEVNDQRRLWDSQIKSLMKAIGS